MYAVIKTGGKQYKVTPGDVIQVEHLKVKDGADDLRLTPLLVVNDKGETIVETKQLSQIPVSAKVLGDTKGDKVTVFKYRSKSGYASKTGHRQLYSLIQITAIGSARAPELKSAEDVRPESTGQQKPAPVEKKEISSGTGEEETPLGEAAGEQAASGPAQDEVSETGAAKPQNSSGE